MSDKECVVAQVENAITIKEAQELIAQAENERHNSFVNALDAFCKKYGAVINARPIVTQDGRIGAQVVIGFRD